MSASPTVTSSDRFVSGPLAIIAALVTLTLAHPSATRMQTWPWATLAAALWIFPVGVLTYFVAARPRWPLPSALVSAGLALLAIASLVSAIASPFGTMSLAQTWPTLGGVALCFLLHHWLTDPESANESARRDRVALIVAGAGALIATTSLCHWLLTATPSPWLDRNTFPFGHSTYTAGFVVLVLPWVVERAWTARGVQRLLWILATFTSIGALMGTSSRGGVLVLVLMAGIAMMSMLLMSRWTLRQKLLLVAAVVVIAGITVFTNPRLRELALRRGWGDTARASNRERSAMLEAGVRLGREQPWLGWGPGAVPLAYPHVRARLEGGDENVYQLHNTPAQLFATVGGLGLASGALLVAGLGIAAVRALRERPISSVRVAAVASLAGYLAFSLTDHQLDLPIVAAMAAAGVAVITAGTKREVDLPRTLRPVFLCGSIALVIAPAIALGRDLLARRQFERALLAMESSNTPEVLAALDRATSHVPADSFFQHTAADWLLRQSESQSTPTRQAELTQAAIARLESSLHTEVHLEFAHFNLAWLLLGMNRARDAAFHFTEAARLVPDKGGVYFGLGLALQAQHRDAEAIRAFALEWINDPRQSTSPAWEVPALAVLKPAIRTDALRLLDQIVREYPIATPSANWARWWLGERIGPSQLVPGFSIESSAFAAVMSAPKSVPLTANYPWTALHAAWRDCTGFDSAIIAHGDGAFAAALARRAQQHRGDFREFLTAPLGDEPALALTYRRQRRGYGVLASHPDAPLLTDVYVVQENRIAAQFAAGLFPPKGWLPGRFLLALLPADPR